MKQGEIDLVHIRTLFEAFEKNVSGDVSHAIEKHGLSKAADVQADIASVREALLNLHVKMFPHR